MLGLHNFITPSSTGLAQTPDRGQSKKHLHPGAMVVTRGFYRQTFHIPASPGLEIIPRNSTRLKLVYCTLTLSGKLLRKLQILV